jgi:hypothetical protein
MGLSNDKILALYSDRRQKGIYGARLGEAIESDEAAFNPREAWPLDFSKKSATTLYQGFRNAADKLDKGIAEDIDVIQRDGEVYVCFKSRIALILNESTQVDEDESDDNSNSGDEPELEVESGEPALVA